MVDLQAELAAVNDRIMSGVAVSEEEWTSVREFIGMFHDDVDFACGRITISRTLLL
jgi:hypothetical protein